MALLCKDTPHNILPIYKALVHGDNGNSLYVFLGKNAQAVAELKAIAAAGGNDTREQEAAVAASYGPNWRKKLGFVLEPRRMYFETDTVYGDDTLAAMKAKIASAIGLESGNDVYVWCNRQLTDKAGFWEKVVGEWSMGEERLMVMGSVAKALLGAVCGLPSSEGLKEIKNDQPLTIDQLKVALVKEELARYVNVPISGFRYTQHGGANVFFPVHPGVGDFTHDPKEPLVLHKELYKHVEYFEPFQRVLHVITKSALGGSKELEAVYFPKEGAFEADVRIGVEKRADHLFETRYKEVRGAFTSDCFVGFAQFRNVVGVPFEFAAFSIDRVFNELEMSMGGVFFAKKITKTSGSMVKMVKRLLYVQSMKSSIMSWVKMEVFKRVPLCDAIIIKMDVGKGKECPATVVIMANGTCDLKLTATPGNLFSVADCESAMLKVNQLLRDVIDISGGNVSDVPMFDKGIFNMSPSMSTTRIMRLTVGGIHRTKGKVAEMKRVETALLASPVHSRAFAHVSTNGNNMHLVYRLLDDYGNDNQVYTFIARFFKTLERDELKHRLMNLFRLTEAQAKEEIRGWRTRYRQEAAKLGRGTYNRSMDVGGAQFVNIRIRRTPMGFRVGCEGVTQLRYYKRILRLLLVLFADAGSGKRLVAPKKKQAVGNASNVANASNAPNAVNAPNAPNAVADDEQDMLDIDQEVFDNLKDDFNMDDFLNEIDLTGPVNNKEDDEDVVVDDPIPDVDVAEPNDGDCDSDDDECGGSKGKNKVDPYYKKFILNELVKADPVLFTVKGEHKESYARACQFYAKRQPVVITEEERVMMDKKYPGSYRNHLNQGSTEELKKRNVYICPDVWCPKSRVALSHTKFEELGNKCPSTDGVEEKPIVFYNDKEYWVNKDGTYKTRHVKFMDADKHHMMLRMPCCYVNPPKTDEEEDESKKGNLRYIKGASIPVNPDRFGLLPPMLSAFMGNKNMGGRSDGTGLINKKTDAYFRYGMELRKQSFLHVMSKVLNSERIQNEDDIIDAIVNHIDMPTFMSLYNGALIKKFLSMVNPTSVHENEYFTEFRAWFTGREEGGESQSRAGSGYVSAFGLKRMRDLLNRVVFFNDVPNRSRAIVLREFMFYMAYKGFKEFMKDDNIIKTHEFLLDLFNMQLGWLNNKGYNIVMIEIDDAGRGDVFMPCSQAAQIRPGRPFVLIVKGDTYYEPMYHIRIGAGADLTVTTRFELDAAKWPGVHKLHRYLKSSKVCRKSLVARERLEEMTEAVKRVGRSVNQFVLDYDFQVVALMLDENVMIPLPRQYSVTVIAGGKYMFLDEALRQVGTFEESAVRGLIKQVNGVLSNQESMIELGDDTEAWGEYRTIPVRSSGSGVVKFVPLGPIDDEVAHPLMRNMTEDMNMLVKVEHSDPRKLLVERNNLVDALFQSLWNEVIAYIKRQRALMEKVQFLRNPLNPIPRAHKVAMLYELIGSFIERVTVRKSESRGIETFRNKVCSAIGKLLDCQGQCKWFDAIALNEKQQQRVVGGKCKLVTPQSIYDIILGRVLMELLNVNTHLKQVSVAEKRDADDVIVFTDGDIKNGRLTKLVQDVEGVDAWGFQKKDKVVRDDQFLDMGPKHDDDKKDKRKNGSSSATADAVRASVLTETFRAVPVGLRADLKGFAVNEVVNYMPMTMYEIFAHVYNVIHADTGVSQMTAAALRDMVIERAKADYTKDSKGTLAKLQYNSAMKEFFKSIGKDDSPDVGRIEAAMLDGNYYPSDYDLALISDICHVNVLVWGRKTKRNLDNQWCLGKFSDALYTVLMEQRFQDKPGIDVYELIVKNKTKILLEPDDFEAGMKRMITNRCKRVYTST